jgi:hypothetical protein
MHFKSILGTELKRNHWKTATVNMWWYIKSGILNLLEPSAPVKACNGISLTYLRGCNAKTLSSLSSFGRILFGSSKRSTSVSHGFWAVGKLGRWWVWGSYDGGEFGKVMTAVSLGKLWRRWVWGSYDGGEFREVNKCTITKFTCLVFCSTNSGETNVSQSSCKETILRRTQQFGIYIYSLRYNG